MSRQPSINRFIGREKEVAHFRDWLDKADAPKILYFHDATEKPEHKGGIGKTCLLRYCAELVSQRQDISVVIADFFNVADRDGIFLAERIISGLQRLFPFWTPTAFKNVLKRFRTKTLPAAEEGEVQLQRVLATEFAQDLQRLTPNFSEAKTLLVFLDTFETIEQSPGLAVLQPGQTFPDTYHIPFIRFVIAGRNRLAEAHTNWQKNSLEVVSVPVEPFDRQEMIAYMEAEAISNIPKEEQQITALYRHTEGRPILIGLVTDVLNHRILTLEELLAVQKADFEQYLVEQINFLENPLNWVILFMAHVYHRFNLDMLEHILKNVDLTEPVREISREMLRKTLPHLSFVRQASTGESFVLHDEMQRLVSRYCWPKHDTDLRTRKAISRCMIEYYEHELADQFSDQERQVAMIEQLYHKLFCDLDAGLLYFEAQMQRAQRLWQLNFARLLLLEASKFRSVMPLERQDTLQFYEAQLLRLKGNLTSIEVIKDLEREADPLWMEQHRAEFLLEAGRCYHERSLLKDAQAYFLRALDAVQDDEQLKAFILSYLGGVCRKQGQLVEAVRFFEQSTIILKGVGNRTSYANTLSTTGSVLAQQGKYEEAIRRCKIALRIREEAFAHKEASELHIGYGLTTLGIIYLNFENILEAERYFKRAFDIYIRHEYKTGISALYNHFGDVELHRGNLEEAQRWFMKGEQASINIEHHINSLHKLGRICLEQGQIQEASSYLQRAIKEAQQLPDYFLLTESLIDLARVMQQMKQEDEVGTLLQQAEEIAEREQYAKSRAAIEFIWAEAALHQMHYHKAFRHLEQHCYYMLQHNTREYGMAIRKTIDVLLTIPPAEQAVTIQELIDGWTSRGLAERHPELIAACKEIQEWSMG